MVARQGAHRAPLTNVNTFIARILTAILTPISNSAERPDIMNGARYAPYMAALTAFYELFIIGMTLQIENLDTPQAIAAAGTFLAVIGVVMAFPGAIVLSPVYGVLLAIAGVILSIISQNLG